MNDQLSLCRIANWYSHNFAVPFTGSESTRVIQDQYFVESCVFIHVSVRSGHVNRPRNLKWESLKSVGIGDVVLYERKYGSRHRNLTPDIDNWGS